MILSDMKKISSFQEIDSNPHEYTDTESEDMQGDIIFKSFYDMREIDGSESENDCKSNCDCSPILQKEY